MFLGLTETPNVKNQNVKRVKSYQDQRFQSSWVNPNKYKAKYKANQTFRKQQNLEKRDLLVLPKRLLNILFHTTEWRSLPAAAIVLISAFAIRTK